jgi:diguanylate cyclase (GGDEF)-like protein
MSQADDSQDAPARPEELRDDLTGLPTRGLLREHLGLALARARENDGQVALLHIGLDDFKLVNDSLGHGAGDEALRFVAARLREHIRQTSLVARPGGDEFCVLLPDLDSRAEDLVEIVVGQIMATLEEPLTLPGAEFELSASVGVSIFPDDAEDEDALLRHADSAMYEAKGLGRGNFVIYAGGTQEALERLVLTVRLREALAQDDFVLHYQPIFDLGSNGLVGVEALLRWREPGGGLIPPLKFIPVAEYTGLIDPIGRWVIESACAQTRAWREAGHDFPVCINASLRQFQAPAFAATMADSLASNGLEPRSLIVEITESTAMREPACVEPVLRELAQMGVRIAIDDFGTGYSSLSRLRHMEVAWLKMDRSFLADVATSAEAARVAGATIALVRALGKVAVAEGVETEEQRSFLVQQDCPLAQGFLLGTPVPAEDVSAALRGGTLTPAT